MPFEISGKLFYISILKTKCVDRFMALTIELFQASDSINKAAKVWSRDFYGRYLQLAVDEQLFYLKIYCFVKAFLMISSIGH
tara:strand:- start:628 stop:873 length:246 start_codon:yes stop_codon:yes gene_type:complete